MAHGIRSSGARSLTYGRSVRDDWDPQRLPDLHGRRYLITGSNAGLGYFSSLQLADAGAHVIMSGRNPNRLSAARAALLRQVPHADIETLVLYAAFIDSDLVRGLDIEERIGRLIGHEVGIVSVGKVTANE